VYRINPLVLTLLSLAAMLSKLTSVMLLALVASAAAGCALQVAAWKRVV
jgi:hypothetical protein